MTNFVDRVKKAEATVRKAKSDHVTAVDNAEKSLKQAEAAYLAGIRHIEKQIDEVEKDYAQKIDSFGSITLYRDHVKSGGKAFKLDSSVVAKVDIDGTIYASRAADGGQEVSEIENTKPMGAHARVDDPAAQKASTLYLTVESDQGRIGTQAKPDKLSDARNFALQISAVAQAAEAGEKEKEAKIAALRSQLAQAKEQTADVDHAKAFLNSVEADNATVVAAEQNLTTLMGKASRKDLVALSEHQLKIKKRKRAFVLAGIIIVVLAVIAVVIVMNLPK